MDNEGPARGQGRMGSWLGDYEDLVRHEKGEGEGDHAAQVRKLWNPVTYRCAFCGASFMSKAMIRHHLEQHRSDPKTGSDGQAHLAA